MTPLLEAIQQHGPIKSIELWNWLVILRRNGAELRDLPLTRMELLNELSALEQAGSIKAGDEGWEFVPSKPKPQSIQGSLFV